MKLPKIYYGYKKIKALWMRQTDSAKKTVMIDALDESMREIVQKYMDDFEAELYKDAV